MDATSTPRRDRKRAETRARIESAAVDLVDELGLEGATVELISERADISPRTFFNYFASKDAAILGLQPRELDAEALAEQLSHAGSDAVIDPIDLVLSLVIDTMGVADRGSPALHRRRLDIMHRHPEVVTSQFVQVRDRQQRLVAHVTSILSRDDRFRDGDLKGQASLILSLCTSSVKVALESRAETAGDPDVSPSPEDEIELVRRHASTLIRSTIRRIS